MGTSMVRDDDPALALTWRENVCGRLSLRAMLLTAAETVTRTSLLPCEISTALGETSHRIPAGRPEHSSTTVFWSDGRRPKTSAFTTARVRLRLALCPRCTVMAPFAPRRERVGRGPNALKEKSTPWPFNCKVRGAPAAFETNVRAFVLAPAACGVKIAVTGHEAPGTSNAGQELVA